LTKEIAFKNVYYVINYGDIANDSQDDLSLVQNAINTLLKSGEGVFFFPTGTDDLIMKTDVNLRVEKPIFTNARNSLFAPSLHLTLAKYKILFLGNSTDNSTAFKTIRNNFTSGQNACNSGLVYLDKIRENNELSVIIGAKAGYTMA
jgi:hypothetical protein